MLAFIERLIRRSRMENLPVISMTSFEATNRYIRHLEEEVAYLREEIRRLTIPHDPAPAAVSPIQSAEHSDIKLNGYIPFAIAQARIEKQLRDKAREMREQVEEMKNLGVSNENL